MSDDEAKPLLNQLNELSANVAGFAVVVVPMWKALVEEEMDPVAAAIFCAHYFTQLNRE